MTFIRFSVLPPTNHDCSWSVSSIPVLFWHFLKRTSSWGRWFLLFRSLIIPHLSCGTCNEQNKTKTSTMLADTMLLVKGRHAFQSYWHHHHHHNHHHHHHHPGFDSVNHMFCTYYHHYLIISYALWTCHPYPAGFAQPEPVPRNKRLMGSLRKDAPPSESHRYISW